MVQGVRHDEIQERGMPMKLVTGVLLAMAIASSPALACKGSEVLYSDDFKELDPGWNVIFGNFEASGGKLAAKSEPGKVALMEYDADFFPGADVCVDILSPNVKDPSNVFAGISFRTSNSTYYVGIRPDGFAGVLRYSGDWLRPVSPRKFDAVKPGAASNTLRVVWKAGDPTVSTFINDKPWVNFKANEANKNRKIGIYAEPESGIFQYSNLKVSTPPR